MEEHGNTMVLKSADSAARAAVARGSPGMHARGELSCYCLKPVGEAMATSPLTCTVGVNQNADPASFHVGPQREFVPCQNLEVT